jgi:hypothetical protein
MAKAITPSRPRGPFGSVQSDMPPGKSRVRGVKSAKAKGAKSAAIKGATVGRRTRQP